MWSPRMGSQSLPINGRRLAVWAALAIGWVLPSTGCQVEYAGMTLPSGKYMHDDVQYLPPGPDFPWANTQAATQRAKMQAMGMEVAPLAGAAPTSAPVAGGAREGQGGDMNGPMNEPGVRPLPAVPAPGADAAAPPAAPVPPPPPANNP